MMGSAHGMMQTIGNCSKSRRRLFSKSEFVHQDMSIFAQKSKYTEIFLLRYFFEVSITCSFLGLYTKEVFFVGMFCWFVISHFQLILTVRQI